MKNQLLKTVLVGAAWLITAQTQAHRAWILPDVTVLSGEAPTVTFDMAVSNSLFNFDHVPMRAEGLVITGPDGKTLAAQGMFTGKFRTVFDLPLTLEGTYRIALASQNLVARWEDEQGKRQFYPARGETFTQEKFDKIVPKAAKNLEIAQSSRRLETFVTNGAPNDKALALSGKGLELKAITHFNDLFVSEAAQFQFFIDGKPAAGVELTLIREGTRYRDSQDEIVVTSAADGKVKVNWKGAGRYYLAASYQDQQAPKPATLRTGSYNAVLEVLPD